MKLVGVALVATVGTAYAQAAFDEVGPGGAQQPAQQLVEAACDVEVDLRGVVATVDVRQRIVNTSTQALGASLEHALPAGAAIVGFRAHGARAIAVPATSPSIEGGSAVLGVDPAALFRRGDGYHVIVQPLAPDHEVTLETRYVTLAEPRGGALRVVLPGRDDTSALAACRGVVRATPGPGARVREVRVDGTAAGTTRAPITIVRAPLVIDVEIAISGARPIAWTQTQALGAGWSASVVSVLAPRVKPAGTRRVVFVIDGSRSMELVGRPNVAKVIERIGTVLPADAEVEAVVFDRQVTRVFGALRPATPPTFAAITAALAARGASNGSDLVGAFAAARQVLAGARGPTMVIVISDGVTGDVDREALARALGGPEQKTSTLDVHAIVLDPATTRSPGGDALRGPIHRFGGSYVEVAVDKLDVALGAIDEWMRPGWLELALPGADIPPEVRAGGGFTQVAVHRGAPRFVLTGRGDRPFRIAARPAPAAPIGGLALAQVSAAAFAAATASPDALDRAQATFARLSAAHPVADEERAFAVLTTDGKVATNRRAMVEGGGRYERVIALADPTPRLGLATAPAAPITASAIAKITLERMFRDQLQPKAYACYQRALGRNAQLAGTATFQLRLGRGEVTEVKLAGLGDAELDACLTDAAYALAPPLPDFAINADDQTIANYPLTFQRRADQPLIVLGDADSTSPLDIDAIEGGVPARGRPIRIDARTPLGTLRPTTP